MKNSNSYLSACKDCYLRAIYPSDDSVKNEPEYQKLFKIAREFFQAGKIDEFSYYLMEGQYLTNLWTAHFILEFENISQKLKDNCYEVIKRYSESRLNEKVAKLEKNWMNENVL
uniref:Uncharacterized protein n=1 Tax=Roseihalotalea indica TaxID=2867963 RepID=A0AA49GLT4_9BACT|nr:hypothetical protein K4G66_21400 [Tunicatimonas sp. TK19036]